VISSIAHPTDFSPESRVAYLHALALALAYRCRLYLLYVHVRDDQNHQVEFPHIRETLAAWGVLRSNAPPEDIERVAGITVRKVDIRDHDPVEGLSNFMMSRELGLIVAASHSAGREGLFSGGSVSARVMRETRTPTLFFGPAFERGFVDVKTGAMSLRRVLMAVDSEPNPWPCVNTLKELTSPLGASVRLAHVGQALPEDLQKSHSSIELLARRGGIAETLLAASANDDMIAMPTDGKKDFWERIVGSPTTAVLGEAKTPVLLIPAEDI
jgi:nucleotide-binding universal stress UspA family protein